MNKLYSVHDHWTDINKKNDVDIESIDGVITGIKVNGEDYSGGKTWNTVFEGSITTHDDDGEIFGIIENLTLNGNSIRVTFNSTVYELPKTEHGYGAENESGLDFSTYPLFIATGEGSDSCTLWTLTTGTYSLKIEEPQSGGGESDFSTAEMTIINSKTTTTVGNIQCISCPIVLVEDNELSGGFYVEANSQKVFDVVLYKGHAHIYAINTGISFNDEVNFETEVSLSGNAVLNDGIDITGDCTITVNDSQPA